MKRKRILLSLVCCGLLLSACARAGGGSGGTATAGPGESSPAQESQDPWPDDLPADLNFDGAEIRIAYPESLSTDLFVDDPSGDVVSEGVYRAQMTVEERLGVTYAPILLSGVRNSYTAQIRTAFQSNSDVYDIIGDMINFATQNVTFGVYTDLAATKYIDLSKPYWNQQMANGFQVNGRVYACSGDANVSYLRQIQMMLCHTKVASDYKIDTAEIQQAVLDGKWTAEMMKGYAMSVFSGADPTSVNLDTDTVGLICAERDHVTPMATAMNVMYYSPNDSGSYELTFGNAHAVDVVQWLVTLFNGNEHCVGTFTAATEESLNRNHLAFSSGRALFITACFDETASVYENIGGDYIVLPYPKWSEEDAYATLSRGTHITSGIIRTCTDTDLASAVLEAMASTGSTYTTPAYFEEAMKIKYSDASPETRQIFDIIRESVAFDWGYYMQYALAQNASPYIYNNILNNDMGWSSAVKSKQMMMQRGFTVLFNKLTDLENQYGN